MIMDTSSHLTIVLLKVIIWRFIKTLEDGVYYLDVSKPAVISGFSIVGTCPELTMVKRRRRGKDVDMFLIEPHLHQGLCELVNCFDM
jgi:hypothetical protein